MKGMMKTAVMTAIGKMELDNTRSRVRRPGKCW